MTTDLRAVCPATVPLAFSAFLAFFAV